MKLRTFILILCLSQVTFSSLYGQWESIGSGISLQNRTYFSISAVNKDLIWAIPIKTDFTANYDYTRSIDGGLTWKQGSLPSSMGSYFPANIFALDENIAWILMVSLPNQDRNKIFKTSDGGLTWTEQIGIFNEAGHGFAGLHFFNENEGVGFGSPGTGDAAIDSLQIFRTSDGGNSWNRIPPSVLPNPLPQEGVWVYSGNNAYEVKGDTIWFVTRASRVFRSINRGTSWKAFEVGISGDTDYPGLASIAFENSLNGIAVTHYPNKAAKTTDGGVTWKQITVPSSPVLAAIQHIPGTKSTYLINDGLGTSTNLLLTRDGGSSWEKLSYSPSINCMQFLSPTLGFAGGLVNTAGNRGIYKWKGDLSDMISETFDSDVNAHKVTLQPNPSRGPSTLDLFLPSATDIQYVIKDCNGKVVSNNIVRQAEGQAKILLPQPPQPGMYIIDICINNNHIVKKWLVLD